VNNAATDVLIVDDDPDMVAIIRIMLDDSGYEVRSARNGKEALESVAEKMPAVVLLDMLMPVMDGWQCARELRARYGRRLPIVVVTAAEHAGSRAEQVDSDDVVAKPFDMAELLGIIARYAPRSGSVASTNAEGQP
jgi:two-component system chemotaxis response regulator CheY